MGGLLIHSEAPRTDAARLERPTPRARARWTPVLLLALAATTGAVGARAEEPKPPGKNAEKSAWRDPATAATRVEEACDAVAEECAAPFTKRPAVRISTREEVREVFLLDFAPLAAPGDSRASPDAAPAASAADSYARSAVAKYEPESHTIYILPDNAFVLAAARGLPAPNEDDLRVILVHEATHALDWTRFPIAAEAKARANGDARKALSAVVEGHAQWVAERVARRWNVGPAFERYTRGITALPDLDDERLRRVAGVMLAELAFGYVQGLEFMKAVHAARGREGIESALRKPPLGTRWIEHPDEWLSGASLEDEPDLDAVLAAARWLVDDSRWAVSVAHVAEATLRTQAAALPEARRPEYLRGFVEARAGVAQAAKSSAQAIVMVYLFRTESDAALFLELERIGDEAKPPASVEVVESKSSAGAGAAGKTPGFASRKVLRDANGRTTIELEVAALGRTVVQVVAVNAPEIDRAAQDAALARLEAFIKDPKGSASLPAPKTPMPSDGSR